jgi:hypothetical protein
MFGTNPKLPHGRYIYFILDFLGFHFHFFKFFITIEKNSSIKKIIHPILIWLVTKQWVSDQTRLFVIFEHIKLVIKQKNTNEFIELGIFFWIPYLWCMKLDWSWKIFVNSMEHQKILSIWKFEEN